MFRHAAVPISVPSGAPSSAPRRRRAAVAATAAAAVLALSACSGSELPGASTAPRSTGSEELSGASAPGRSSLPPAPLPSATVPSSSVPLAPVPPADPGTPGPERPGPQEGKADTSDGAAPGHGGDGAVPSEPPSTPTAADEQTLRRWAADTWRSMTAMVDENTGLVADHIGLALDDPSPYTSPTNIAGYLWSTIVVRDLGIISVEEARTRLSAALEGLSRLERHAPSGMFYNWYSPETGAKLTAWPLAHGARVDTRERIDPFLSTVDNGWLAAALRIVTSAEPALSTEAERLSAPMDFAWFHDPSAAGGAGLNRVGFWPDRPSDDCAEPADGSSRATGVFVTCASYGTTVSEARMATYEGVARGQIPGSTYFAPSRTGAASGSGDDWMRAPRGERHRYDGVDVIESTFAYDDMRIVPSWGGGMFEALMPDLLVPEAQWGPRSWGLNHPATVAAQKRHGLDEVGAGYWGFSPSADPSGGYARYGVTGLSIDATLRAASTSARGAAGGDGSTNGVELPQTSRWRSHEPDEGIATDDVVTPHASFLALAYDARGALDNLARLETVPGMYGAGGFADALDPGSGRIAATHLSLDQSMVLAAVGNALDDDALKGYLVDGVFEDRVRPLVEQQVFGSTAG